MRERAAAGAGGTKWFHVHRADWRRAYPLLSLLVRPDRTLRAALAAAAQPARGHPHVAALAAGAANAPAEPVPSASASQPTRAASIAATTALAAAAPGMASWLVRAAVAASARRAVVGHVVSLAAF